MSNSCFIPPKEASELYKKAGQIYADKVIASRFDETIESIADKDGSIDDYKNDFIESMREAAFDPRHNSEQENFYDKIINGLEKKIPEIVFVDVMDADFTDGLDERFSGYFDANKKAIASKIIELRREWVGEEISEPIENLKVLLPELRSIRSDTKPKEIAQRAGLGIGKLVLEESGKSTLEKAKSVSSDLELQKSFSVDTLENWANGNEDSYYPKAWEVFDKYASEFEGIVEDIDRYLGSFDAGTRQAFSDYFNKQMGTTSEVPLRQKSKENADSTRVAKDSIVPLSKKSKEILEKYALTKDLDILFDEAEDQDQLAAMLVESAKRKK